MTWYKPCIVISFSLVPKRGESMVKRAVGCFIVIVVILTGTNIQYTRVIRRICEGLKAIQRVGTCRTAIRLVEVKRIDDDAMRNVAVGSAWRKSARFESAF